MNVRIQLYMENMPIRSGAGTPDVNCHMSRRKMSDAQLPAQLAILKIILLHIKVLKFQLLFRH